MTEVLVKTQTTNRQKRLGQRIRLGRISAGLSQRQLGRAVYLSQSAICEYETGGAVPSFLVIQSIAEALGQPLTYFQIE